MKRFIKRATSIGLTAAFLAGTMLTSSAAGETIIITRPWSSDYNVQGVLNNYSAAVISLDKTEVTYNLGEMGGIVNVTTSGGDMGATVSVLSDNAAIVSAEYFNGRIFITPKSVGTANITVTYGDTKANLKVTVAPFGSTTDNTTTTTPSTAKEFKFYSDAQKQNAKTEFDGLWVNGGNVTMPDKTKVNYKDLTVYTDFEPILTDPKPDDNKVESKAGKPQVAVTAVGTTTPPFADKKAKSEEAASKIVKASYKSGQVKVTAGSEAGSARVWLLDVAANGTLANYNSFVVSTKAAAANIIVTDSAGATVKAVGLSAGQSATYSFKGYLKDKKTVAADSTYTVTVDNKYADNIKADYNAAAGTIKITGVKTNGGKTVKAKVTVMCNQSGKKATITVSVTNPTSTIKATLAPGSNSYLHWKGDTVTLNIAETTSEGFGGTTDKVKVFVSDDTTTPLTVDEKGKVKYTKSKAASGSYKNGVLTLKRNDPLVVGTVYLVYTDSATKTSKAFKICNIAAIKISAGDVTLA